MKVEIKVTFSPFNHISSQITVKPVEEPKGERHRPVRYTESPFTSDVKESVLFQMGDALEPINSLNAIIG